MKKFIELILSFIIILISVFRVTAQSSLKFAVIGDYGNAGPDELAVANLVKSWNPDFIITLGDNNYDIGSASTIDANIGQYYHDYIFPYTGSYGTGAAYNRFFPSLGNHDWETAGALPFLNYFVLPGNERYYDFVKGAVHFFVIDSDINEPDGRDSNSVQAIWLKNSLALSSSKFNIVYFHHPPYCSGLIQGSEIIMRWPFKSWGASAVMSGHEHLYERLNVNGLPYFVNGLGGNLRSIFGFPISGSQVRYSANYGAMFVTANSDSLVLKFYNIANSLRDNYKILPAIKTLSLKAFIQGFYDENTNVMISDTVKITLRNFQSPFEIIDSAKVVVNNSGIVMPGFHNADNATDYYIVISHRNSIETWSSSGNSFVANVMSYDFSNSASKAFGNNQILKGIKYCIYSGDTNQDGVVDAADLSNIENSILYSESGYVNTDVNGDSAVDAGDLSIAENNSEASVTVISP
ncbi:MAG TPA: metallophosphoesterase [Ignavibacteria bacterium]|nr:metallophosphoesterase [Ignavibacteria bacterium]